MYERRTMVSMGGFSRGPIPWDILALAGFVFLTFCLQFFSSTAGWLAPLRLSWQVLRDGSVWRLATYPFVGFGGPSLWFLLSVLVLIWFGRDVFARLGRRRFWRLILGVSLVAGGAALLVEWLLASSSLWPERVPFLLIQGQQILLVILVAAFASLYSTATLLLFFVVPVRAGWFLGVEILLGFVGFLWSKDLAGLLGLCVAVGLTWAVLSPGRARQLPRRLGLGLRQRWLELRLAWLKRRRGLKVIDGGKGKRGPWVN
ncbi:MAG TPA: hypothetical protein PK413_00405 [Thermoanaerobaculia bacterium]|nr:hypothetical protein [Thermoanaerobaculia bacterium]